MADIINLNANRVFETAEAGNANQTEKGSEDILQFAYEGSIYRGDKKLELNLAAMMVRTIKEDSKG